MNSIGKDIGIDKVKKWLADWYGELDDVNVEIIKIACPDYSNELLDADPIYKDAQVGRQTPLHVFLKYLAYHWLQANNLKCKPRFETRMYFPDEEFFEEWDIRLIGTPFDIKKSQIIEKGNKHVNASYGYLLIVDVYGNNTSIEVGFTRPWNLFTPLLEGLSKQAIWLPFPLKSEPKLFSVNENTYTEFLAYKITLTE